MWTLHVEDFGRIEKADITVSPLTLFVGDNNSGKSYLLSLLYGIMCADESGRMYRDECGVLSNLCEDSPEYQACVDWLEKALESGKEKVPFDDCAYAVFENLFNRILQDNQQDIFYWIFNEELSAGKISVTFARRKSEVFDIKEGMLSFAQYGLSEFDPEQWNVVIDYVLEAMILSFFPRWGPYEKVDFLPAARNGFLSTYPNIDTRRVLS